MSIIVRYITKEIALAFLTVTSLLFLILLSNRFSLYLGKAASGQLPVGLVFEMVGLYTPELLSYLIPVGLYMGILFAYGRLYTDSEMAIFSACGISPGRIVGITLLLAAVGVLITAFLTLWIVPRVSLIREHRLSQGENLGLMGSLLPQRFQSINDDQSIVYLEQVSKEGLSGVFITERPVFSEGKKEDAWVLITAKTAAFQANPSEEAEESVYVVLKNGYRYQGLPGKANYSVIAFEEYGRALNDLTTAPTASDSMRLIKSADLRRLSDPEAAAELQWRLSLPLSVFVLAMMAIPLSRVYPRQGRFSRFVPAVILYVLYYNLFTICRRWVASGALSSTIGSWWVHGVFLSVALGVMLHDRKPLK